jgi:protein involved in polysaccharide export with SLBB domain
LAAFWGILGTIILLPGCRTETEGPIFADVPTWAAGTQGAGSNTWNEAYSEVFHIGDLIMISFSATHGGNAIIPPYEERIKEDRTITPPHIGSVTAEGKRPGELQKELQERYDKLFRNLTVTVKAGERYYFVDGEVNRRGQVPWVADTDIIKAIAAAGGFTDFARKGRVTVIHPNNKKEVVDYNEALDNPSYKVPIYPGDRIIVHRRFL